MKSLILIFTALLIHSTHFAVSSSSEYQQVFSKFIQQSAEQNPSQKEELIKAFNTLKKAGIFSQVFQHLNDNSHNAQYQNIMKSIYLRAIKKAESVGLGAAVVRSTVRNCRLPEKGFLGYSIKCLVFTRDSMGGEQTKEKKVKLTEQEFLILTK